MRRHPAVQMLVLGVILLAIILPVVLLVIPWFPSKASTQADNIHTLYDVLLIASVPIFVLVETVVLYSVWKFRMRPGQELEDGPPIHGNTRLEVAWTAAPAILIIGLCAYAYTVLRSDEATKNNAMTVNVTARQFEFEFSYPVGGGRQIVSSELYLPDNRPVVFKLRSLDVIHSFFVPNFSEKLDAVPGITTTLRVTPNVLGTYPVECTELCGAGHSLMRSTVHVVTPTSFESWLRAQNPNAPPPLGLPPPNAAQPGVPGSPPSSGAPTTSSSATSTAAAGSSTPAAGKVVFTGAGTCSTCHTLAAAGATGTVGPDLDTRLRSDCALPASKTIRGATLTACIHTAITHPYAYLPTGYSAGIMPSTFAQTLSPTQIQALVSFLSTDAK